MTQKREKRLRISAMPWRKGLLTAGQQSTIEETSLWQAKNATAELDGLLSKRPGLKQWGQTLKHPDADSDGATAHWLEVWLDIASWQTADSSSGLVAMAPRRGHIRTTVAAGSSNESLVFYRTATSTETEWSVRVTLQITDAPVYTPAATDPNTLVIRADSDGSSGKEFAVHDDGLYYKKASDDTYELVAGTTAVGNGGWHTIEIRCEPSGSTLVYVDDVLAETLTSSALKTVALSTDAVVEFRWEVEGGGTDQYSTQLGPTMWIDSDDDPFAALEVRAVGDFRYLTPAGSDVPALLAAAGGYVYVDNGQAGVWLALLQTDNSETFLTTYRRTAIIIDYSGSLNTVVWQWTGNDDPEVLDDAPNIKFCTEHKQRLWGAGNYAEPLRLYWSGDRQPNLWYDPSPDNIESQIDAVEQAGYLEVPAKKGDRIVAVYGDFYGRLLVFTRRGVWQVSGDGPNSFGMSAVTQDVGAESPDCVTQVGNDIWFLSRYGVQSLQSSDQFGDIQSSFPSAPISDLWGQNPSAVKRVVRDYQTLSKLKYNPTQGLVYCAVPTTGQTTPDSVFIYNVNTKEWYGPWEIESRAMENVEVESPQTEVMLHGSTSGQVRYTHQGGRRDVDSAYTMVLQSAILNGRSLDPRLPAYEKTWKVLRLFLLPRGNWDFTVKWKTDAEPVNNNGDGISVSQNISKGEPLGAVEGDGTGEFRLGVDPWARLQSREQLSVLEIDLSASGRSLWFQLEQGGLGQDLVIQGFEVEFIATGYSKE